MRLLQLVMTAVLALVAMPSAARLPSEAPPLPPPDPATYTVVNVSTVQALANAVANLSSNEAIVIAPGTYDLSSIGSPLAIGQSGAISNVQLRGATGDPSDVAITGMFSGSVQIGVYVLNATDVLIADLSLYDFELHAVLMGGSSGADRVHLYHVNAFDTGESVITSPSSGSDGADDVVIEYSEISYTNGAPIPSSCGLSGGVYGRDAQRWILRDNIFRGIYCADGVTLAGPAVLLWGGSSDSVVERNLFLASSRGVLLGLVSTPGDHSGGVVRNNFFRVEPSAAFLVDTAIGTASPNSRILHNSIVAHGQLFATVEARWATTTNVTIQNNLMDQDAIRVRNGATTTQLGNISNAQSSWFANEAGGDLHLVEAATAAMDQVDRVADAEDDFDAVTRPSGSGEADVGADEFVAAQVPSMGTLGFALLAAGMVLLAALSQRLAAIRR